jgi:hypothetical protein
MRIFVAVLLTFIMTACASSDGTSTGNPLVSLKFDSFNSSLAFKTAADADVDVMAVSSLKMCFKRLRFKLAGEATNPDPEQDEDNIDFYLGEVAISDLGTTLKSVALPVGTYKRIEFDLDDDCSSGNSMSLTNSHGSFETSDRITIKFNGTFVHDGSEADLGMNIQAIVTALKDVQSDNDIEDEAESVDGSF